jgi:hypothetical protein
MLLRQKPEFQLSAGLHRRVTVADQTIQIPDEIYQLLHERAQQLGTTPEAIVSQLAHAWLTLPDAAEHNENIPDEPVTTDTALAAVRRLTGLFADVTIPNFEQVVTDPMLSLENTNLINSDHA